MNDSNDSRMVRLPVREMSDEPAPQRAAQEGGLPPLLTDEQILRAIHSIGQDGWGRIALTYESGPYDIDKPTNVAIRLARAIESEVRLALAAAGGGVPRMSDLSDDAFREHVEAVIACLGDDAAALRAENDEDERAYNMDAAAELLERMLASSHQPEAAPAFVQHDSDCALHNGPALPVGPCDCSVSKSQVAVAEFYEALELPLERLVDLCNTGHLACFDEVIAAEAALERLYRARTGKA